MHRRAKIRSAIAAILVAGICPVCRGGIRIGGWDVLRSDSATAAKSANYSRVSIERAELPAGEYRKLRNRALENSQVRTGPRMRNPEVTKNGLELPAASALEEQRGYLKTVVEGREDSSVPQASCATPMIRMVNGRSRGVVFTPQPPDNVYRIEGCGFGEEAGEIRLELDPHADATATFRPLILQTKSSDSWRDDVIEVAVDSRLTGRLDASVTLAVYAASGRRIELAGCTFVATRGAAKLLTTIPAAWVELHATTVKSRAISQLEYVSPAMMSTGWGKGTSAAVVRSDAEPFVAGTDTFDFSHLNPGWVVDSVQMQTYSAACPGNVTERHSLGHWSTEWETKRFKVMWEDDVCTAFVPPSFNFSLSSSEYAARVWVIGPLGTDPVAINKQVQQSDLHAVQNSGYANSK